MKGEGAGNNLDVCSNPGMCSEAVLFVVDDDCVNGVDQYKDVLRPRSVLMVKPGLLAVQMNAEDSLEGVTVLLKPFSAFPLPDHHRVVSLSIQEGGFVPAVTPFKSPHHLRTTLPRLDTDDKQAVSLSNKPALTQAATLSLPLAKLRLTERREAISRGVGQKYKALVFHCPTMTCTSCTSRIYKRLRTLGLKPSTDCYISLTDKEVVCLVPQSTTPDELRAKIEDLLDGIEKPHEPRTRNTRIGSIHVSGMTCKSCVARIKKELDNSDVSVDLAKGLVENVPQNMLEQYIAAINKLGKYTAVLSEIVPGVEDVPVQVETSVTVWERRLETAVFGTSSAVTPAKSPAASAADPIPPASIAITMGALTQSTLIVRGMTCVSCVSRIEEHLSSIPGIESVSVALATEMAKVVHLDTLGIDIIAAELTQMGYPSTPLLEATEDEIGKRISKEEDKAELWAAAMSSLLLSSPLVIMMLLGRYIKPLHDFMMYQVYNQITAGAILQLVLSTPVVYLYGTPFFNRAYKALQHSTATMDVLVSLGVGTAYASGWIFVLFDIGSPAADTAAVLLAFMLLGKYFECVAKGRTASELKSLLELRPTTAEVVQRVGGEAVEVPAEQVKKGDIVRVMTGAKVPVDGEIIDGTIEIDQSMITGESIPVTKGVKDAVTGGTVCCNGVAHIMATHVGHESTLSQIVRLINDAQASKAPVQQLADRIAKYFVPVVVLVALISFGVWFTLGTLNIYPADWRGTKSVFSFALTFMMTSLVVACPCAMGLATPTAVMVATGVGAKLGVFIKGGEVLEAAAKVNAVLFDKTGTLTTGKVKVTDSMYFGKSSQKDTTLAMVAAVESGSQHPVATAVMEYCKAQMRGAAKVPVDHLTTPGRGVTCFVDGAKVCAGSSSWVLGMAKNKEAADVVKRWNGGGLTVVLCSVGEEVVWAFGLRDTLKAEAAGIVRYLQQKGVRVCIVTGDNREAALDVAKKVGVEEDSLFAEVLPGDKAAVVARVKEECGVVTFVGDGINDAPALAAADVGIALGSGTSVAIDSADAVLTKSDLADVAALLSLATATLNRIKLNFFWAFGYNVLALPVASGLTFPLTGQLPPILGGIAMIFSSLLVLTSSLLLGYFTPPKIHSDRVPFASTGGKSYSTF